MKTTIYVLILFFVSVSFSQELPNVKLKKQDGQTWATYFYDDGTVQQQGMFNENGKLDGIWVSFDTEGNKIAEGKYDNGKKVGKWFFWLDDALMEVDYEDSKIATVNKWKRSATIAVRE